MTQDELKKKAAEAAIEHVPTGCILGVGTGSTVNHFIPALKKIKGKIDAVLSSSQQSTDLLKEHGFHVEDLNSVSHIDLYVDGADETNHHRHLIKGGGGALTCEKILTSISKKFVCIVDETKIVDVLGKFPLPVSVIPMARSAVARELTKMGGQPIYREGFVTDNKNVILDVHNMELTDPVKVEEEINQITGVVTNGLFAARGADLVLVAKASGIESF